MYYTYTILRDRVNRSTLTTISSCQELVSALDANPALLRPGRHSLLATVGIPAVAFADFPESLLEVLIKQVVNASELVVLEISGNFVEEFSGNVC